MTRDESIYPDPERFNPARFFTPDGNLNDDTVNMAFGLVLPGLSGGPRWLMTLYLVSVGVYA